MPIIRRTLIGELSGAGASAGTMFKNGVEMAVKEINAAGGILGKKIEHSTSDTQTNPGVAKGLTAKAIDDECLCDLRPGVLRLDHGQHGRDAARRGAQLHRWRGRSDHPAGQPLHLPHQLHPGQRDAEGGRYIAGGQGQERWRSCT
jgi:hypothetical protein